MPIHVITGPDSRARLSGAVAKAFPGETLGEDREVGIDAGAVGELAERTLYELFDLRLRHGLEVRRQLVDDLMHARCCVLLTHFGHRPSPTPSRSGNPGPNV